MSSEFEISESAKTFDTEFSRIASLSPYKDKVDVLKDVKEIMYDLVQKFDKLGMKTYLEYAESIDSFKVCLSGPSRYFYIAIFIGFIFDDGALIRLKIPFVFESLNKHKTDMAVEILIERYNLGEKAPLWKPTSEMNTKLEEIAKELLKDNDPAHDYIHASIVRRNAVMIASTMENVNYTIIEFASLLHDACDRKAKKLLTHGELGTILRLNFYDLESHFVKSVISTIENISFSSSMNETKEDLSTELMIVRDADRLEALGARGIARCMAYSGYMERKIYDPEIKPNVELTQEEYLNKNKSNDTALGHFHEKLYKLSDLMHTEKGKQMARERTQYMMDFEKRFVDEVYGKV